MGVGEARAKLLLFGEHAAVYGHPAVGCALDWRVTAFHVPGPWEFPGLGRHEAVVRNLIDRLTGLACEEALPLPASGRVDLTSDVPLGSGFGSSGALCAALVNLFWPDLPLDDRDRLAWRAEGLFHGTPSGIDTALALRTGWWQLDASIRPVRATPLGCPNIVLVAGAVVRESDTRTLVGGLARRRAEGDSFVVSTLDRLGALARSAVDQLTRGDQDLASLVGAAREGLRALGLESAPLATVLDQALARTGALAGKLSGAGGGGAFFLVYPDPDAARAALPQLEGLLPAALWTARPTLVNVGHP